MKNDQMDWSLITGRGERGGGGAGWHGKFYPYTKRGLKK